MNTLHVWLMCHERLAVGVMCEFCCFKSSQNYGLHVSGRSLTVVLVRRMFCYLNSSWPVTMKRLTIRCLQNCVPWYLIKRCTVGCSLKFSRLRATPFFSTFLMANWTFVYNDPAWAEVTCGQFILISRSSVHFLLLETQLQHHNYVFWQRFAEAYLLRAWCSIWCWILLFILYVIRSVTVTCYAVDL